MANMAGGTRFILTIIAAALLGGSLTACNPLSSPPPGVYVVVDRAAQEISLGAAGDVLAENHYGGAVLGDSATYVVTLGGGTAPGAVEEALTKAAYVHDLEAESQSRWVGLSDGHDVEITVMRLEAGDTASLGNKSFKMPQDGVVVWVQAPNLEE